MTLYAADTHVIIWYWSGSPRLSATAHQLLDDAFAGRHAIVISPIVLAELILIAEKQRAPLSLPAVIAALTSTPAFQLVSLSPSMALHTQQLTALPDIHDRLIVAAALTFGATLITQDRAITQSGVIPVIW
ncbi:MAG: type II toxin-antitoxin system VapC family toxin [Caldilineaceae bacterium]